MNFSALVQLVQAHPGTVFSVVWGSLGLSVFIESLLTKYKVQSKKIGFMLLHLFSALSGVATWYASQSFAHGAGVYAGLFIVAGTWHRFVVSDVNQKYITPFLQWLTVQKAPADSVENEPIEEGTDSLPSPGDQVQPGGR